VLTWVVGSHVLGPYSRGTEVHNNAFALLADFYVGLFSGYLVFWVVALGPYLFFLLIRILLGVLRRTAPKAAPDG